MTINKNPRVEKWLVFGPQDSTTTGAVRALEGHGFTAENVIAVGINGDSFAISEFEKESPTGFFARLCSVQDSMGMIPAA